jgi:hypothetical protein
MGICSKSWRQEPEHTAKPICTGFDFGLAWEAIDLTFQVLNPAIEEAAAKLGK